MRIYGWKVQGSGYSWSSAMAFIFGVSDQSTNQAYNGNGDAFGFQVFVRASGGMVNNVLARNDGTYNSGGNSSVGEGGTNLSTDTKYYIEFKRTSATAGELRIYSDEDFTTLHTAAYVSDSALGAATGLRYFTLNGQTTGGTHVVTIDKVEFWDDYTGVIVSDEKASISKVPIGTRYEETDTRQIFRKDTYGWKERNATTYASMDSFRGCFCGGQASTNTIDYITIETTGDATDFGDLTGNTGAAAGCDNNSRGIIGHGSNNIMDYITIGTTGNATDFGDRNNTGDEIGACSDQTTRGIFFGGAAGSRESIDYVTIASAGNATDFGDMTDGRSAPAGLGDTTRGCMGGGSTGSIVNIIDYITISSTGNATDFGDLTQARRHLAGTADETRGVFAGGHASYNNIDYITIQTTGNATDFGDLVNGRYGIAGVSNYARGVFGSSNVSGVSNQMDYITIATLGNATDFGDLTVARSNAGGVSGN